MKKILPDVFYNPISLVGAVIALFNVGFIVFLSVVEMLSEHPKAYADIIIFFILPIIVFFGLILVIVGIVRERRRQQREDPHERRLPIIDFNNPIHRKTLIILSVGFVFLSLLYAFTGYKTYEYVESDHFCNFICHSIHPVEYKSYKFSAHAEIGCVDCHVGPGAEYFVMSKLNGTSQLIEVVFNTYEQPIPVPIKNLRPSKDICENCHGPKYFFEERLETRTHFLSDKKNTEWTVALLLKMGKAEIKRDRPPKIHWHSSTTEQIMYATTDPKRMDIPWISVKRHDGTERTYKSTENPLTDEALNSAPKRVMDCIDCHNRAGHPFNPPHEMMNIFLKQKLIDPTLPEIKSIAVQALEGAYNSKDEAHGAIRSMIVDFYAENYPDVKTGRTPELDRAISEILRIYDLSYDSHMKVSWKNFPDNIGHMYAKGCFRCHDGKHVTDDGRVLPKDCTLCHLLITHEVEKDEKSAVLNVLDYPHPVDIGDSYREMNCSDCHGSM